MSCSRTLNRTNLFNVRFRDRGALVRQMNSQYMAVMATIPVSTFAFLDLESTGLAGVGERPRITELSIVAIHREMLLASQMIPHSLPRVMDKMTVCVYPMKPVTPVAASITGLYNDNLYHQKDFDPHMVDMLTLFLQRLDPPVCLIAHNGNNFDFGLLMVELQRHNKTLPVSILCADSLATFKALDQPEEHMASCSICRIGKTASCSPQNTEKLISSLDKGMASSPNTCTLIETKALVQQAPKSDLNEMQLVNEITPEIHTIKSEQSSGESQVGKRKSSEKAPDIDGVLEQAHKVKRKLFPDDFTLSRGLVNTCTDNSNPHCIHSDNIYSNRESTSKVHVSLKNYNTLPVPTLRYNQSSTHSSISSGESMVSSLVSRQSSVIIRDNLFQFDGERTPSDISSPGKSEDIEQTVEYWNDILEEFSDVAQEDDVQHTVSSISKNSSFGEKCNGKESSIVLNNSKENEDDFWIAHADISDEELLTVAERNSHTHTIQVGNPSCEGRLTHQSVPPCETPVHPTPNQSRLLNLPQTSADSTTKKPKLSYSLAELHKRVLGIYPEESHRAEDDCLAMVRLFQKRANQVCPWVDLHCVPFISFSPLYTTKPAKPLPPGVFPYQL